MEIKHRFSDTTLCSFDVVTIREAAEQGRTELRGADLYGADLYGADLYGANLNGANLNGADLRGADLYGANLNGADLRGANLNGADLRGANLNEADLRGTNMNGADLRGAELDKEKIEKNPLIILGLTYWCLISDNYMRLGCKRFTHDEWNEFDDNEIAAMDRHALKFWTQWKAPLLAMCDTHKTGL